MNIFATPEAVELDRFAQLLDKFPHLTADTRRRLFFATIGCDFENERQVYWATSWLVEIAPGLTLKMLVWRENPALTHREIPTASQIIHALKAHADHKENAS